MRRPSPLPFVAAILVLACGSASDAGLTSGGLSGSGGTAAGGDTGASGSSSGGSSAGTGGSGAGSGAASSGGTTTGCGGACQSGCTTNTDCAGNTDGRTTCDTNAGQCVQCVFANNCPPGNVCIDHACSVLNVDAGGQTGAGGMSGSGGDVNVGGSGGNGGAWASVPEGAWTKCNQDADCTGGRVCSKALQSVVVSGRPGGCVKTCTIATPGSCDLPPTGAGTACVNFGIGVCTLSCVNGGCPDGMTCVANLCFWNN